jgi:hypothetical protein
VLASEELLTDPWRDADIEDEPLTELSPLNEPCILWETDEDPEDDTRGVSEAREVPDTLPIGELLADSLFDDDPDTVVRGDSDSRELDDLEGTPDTLPVPTPDKDGWTDWLTDGELDIDAGTDTEGFTVTLPLTLCIVVSECEADGEDDSDDWNDKVW